MDPFVASVDSANQDCEPQNSELDVGPSMAIRGNPAAGVTHSDILEVDLSSMGYPLRKVVYATDDWVGANYLTRHEPESHEINAKTNDIDLLFDSVSFFIPSKFADVLKYHMNLDTVGNDVERKFPSSLNINIDHGTYDDQEKATITLGEPEQAWGKVAGSNGWLRYLPDGIRTFGVYST